MFQSWIILLACTVWVSLLAFFWALENGQFSDQNRARYLPLADETRKGPADLPAWKGRERYLFLCIAASMLTVFGAAIFLSLTSG